MRVRLVGADENSELLEADLSIAAVPRIDETITVWSNTYMPQGGEIDLKVQDVIHKAYGDAPWTEIHVYRAEGLSDEDWRGVFIAINERQEP